MSRRPARAAAAALALALALPAGGCGGAELPPPLGLGGDFTLTATDGSAWRLSEHAGKPTVLFFGFTFCPDICPGTLVAVKRAYDALPEGVEAPQTLLITVDPERDTPEALAQYVSTAAFPDNLVGLTGTADEIAAAAEAFIAQYERIETPDSLTEYTMDHTSLLYLMDENWQLKTFFAEADADPEYIAQCLAQHIG